MDAMVKEAVIMFVVVLVALFAYAEITKFVKL